MYLYKHRHREPLSVSTMFSFVRRKKRKKNVNSNVRLKKFTRQCTFNNDHYLMHCKSAECEWRLYVQEYDRV